MSSGTLYVVATPIGNLSDISFRALEVLRSVDRIAAEDTRHTRKLLTHYDIHKPLVSYHSHNIQKRGSGLVEKLLVGEDLALVTDAGTPGISDPGSLLIRQALNRDVEVVSIPGPVALITALVVSGLPTHPFAFLGFPPSRGSGRRRFLESYAALPMTIILYESPQRLRRTLKELFECWGDRQVAVARELTKKYEEVYRGSLAEARNHFAEGVRGEITLVVAGAEGEGEKSQEAGDWADELEQLMLRGHSVKEAADFISAKFGISRREIYQKALKLKTQLKSGEID